MARNQEPPMQTLPFTDEFMQDLIIDTGVPLHMIVNWMKHGADWILHEFARFEFYTPELRAAVIQHLGPTRAKWLENMKDVADTREVHERHTQQVPETVLGRWCKWVQYVRARTHLPGRLWASSDPKRVHRAVLGLLLTIFADLQDNPVDGYCAGLLGHDQADPTQFDDSESADATEHNAVENQEDLADEQPPQKKRKFRGNRSGTSNNKHHRKQASKRTNKVARKVLHPSDPLPGYTAEQPPQYEDAPEYFENVDGASREG